MTVAKLCRLNKQLTQLLQAELRLTVLTLVPVRKAARRDASMQIEDGVTDRSYAGLVT